MFNPHAGGGGRAHQAGACLTGGLKTQTYHCKLGMYLRSVRIETLQAEAEGRAGLGEAAAWQVAAEVAAGLAFLHAAGVLHLDVKPGNVFADGAGGLRLGDFGLAVLRHQWVSLDFRSSQLSILDILVRDLLALAGSSVSTGRLRPRGAAPPVGEHRFSLLLAFRHQTTSSGIAGAGGQQRVDLATSASQCCATSG